MRSLLTRSAIALLIVGTVVATSSFAVTLVRMNLGDMVSRADRIFSGTVIEAHSGTVQAGGGDMPVMIYKVAVDDSFKGTFTEIKAKKIAEITMLGKLAPVARDGVQRFDHFDGIPILSVGRNYLLFQSRPSAIGLSSTIGLGQGNFQVAGKGPDAQVENEFGNAGLFAGMEIVGAPARGPVSYSFMVEQIRAQLGGQ
jgi:hypothetical protein